mgnify:CR=1 FL=1
MDMPIKLDLETQQVLRWKNLYVCDQGNGRIRVVNLQTLFCYACQIVQGDHEDSQSEEQDYTVRCIRKVHVDNLSLISEGNVPDLVSPFAICASAKDSVARSSWQDFLNFWCCTRGGNWLCQAVKWIVLFWSIQFINFISLNVCRPIPVSWRREGFMYSSLSSEKTTETENNFESLMGIAVTDGGAVFLSSSK